MLQEHGYQNNELKKFSIDRLFWIKSYHTYCSCIIIIQLIKSVILFIPTFSYRIDIWSLSRNMRFNYTILFCDKMLAHFVIMSNFIFQCDWYYISVIITCLERNNKFQTVSHWTIIYDLIQNDETGNNFSAVYFFVLVSGQVLLRR